MKTDIITEGRKTRILTGYKESYWKRLSKSIMQNKSLYIMMLPVVAWYLIFHYGPMYGAIIAFKDFSPGLGIFGSKWVGLQNFVDFFQSIHFERIFRNTIIISLSTIIFGFPAPIILALLINEIRSKRYKSIVQTSSYLPHFISMVVVCGMIKNFTNETGIITYLLGFFGFNPQIMLNNADYFVPIYIISDIWQSIGWNSIIYLAALAGINQELYEAAKIDGAGRWRQTFHITIPGILPTVMIMLILRMGGIMNVGHEKIILLYNPVTYETADVISSYVYRKGIKEANFSYSTAVGLFNSVINFAFLIGSNKLSKKFNETSLW